MFSSDFIREKKTVSFRLSQGAYAHGNSSLPKSVISTDSNAVPTNPATTTESEGTNTSKPNVIVSTRLRQTNKRLLRKIQSSNKIIPTQDRSTSKAREEQEISICCFFLEKSVEGNGTINTKQSQVVYRNKNGQFTSPPDGSKFNTTVDIFE